MVIKELIATLNMKCFAFFMYRKQCEIAIEHWAIQWCFLRTSGDFGEQHMGNLGFSGYSGYSFVGITPGYGGLSK